MPSTNNKVETIFEIAPTGWEDWTEYQLIQWLKDAELAISEFHISYDSLKKIKIMQKLGIAYKKAFVPKFINRTFSNNNNTKNLQEQEEDDFILLNDIKEDDEYVVKEVKDIDECVVIAHPAIRCVLIREVKKH